MANKINKDDLEKFILNDPEATITSLAHEFKVSTNCIYRYINKYNMKYNRKKSGNNKRPEIKDRIEKCIKDNPDLNLGEIGKILGKSRQGIWNHLMTYRINYKSKKGRKSSINKETLEKFILKNPDAGLKELGSFFKKNPATILNYIRKHKINYKSKKPRNIMNKNDLQEYILKNPHLTQKMLGEKFNVSQGIISMYIRKYNLEYPRGNKMNSKIKTK